MDLTAITDLATGFVVEYGLKVVGVILVLIGTWIVAGWVRRALRKRIDKTRLDKTLSRFFANLGRIVILIVGVLAALEIFGVETTSFVAIIGAAGLAIGLALQGTLSNFSAGVMLLIFRPFKAGDAINAAGVLGKVDEIGMFTTTLDTVDNRRIIVPNGEIYGSTIETITHHPIRRADVNVGVDYGADIDETRRVLEAAVAAVPGRLEEPASQVYLVDLGDSSVNWQLRVWCNTADFFAIKERTTEAAKKALDAAGIGIPFPQMDVHLDGVLHRGDGAPA